jgi:hypothetical protein
MKKTRKPTKPVSPEAIARLADQGKDISHFFKGQGRMVQPIQRVNVDLTATMLQELQSGRRSQCEPPSRHQDARAASS